MEVLSILLQDMCTLLSDDCFPYEMQHWAEVTSQLTFNLLSANPTNWSDTLIKFVS